MAESKPAAPDPQPPSPIVCVTTRPQHGRMGWGDCIACGYDETLTYHALAARPVAR